MDNSLNNKIKSLRQMLGLTQKQFADNLGITQSYLSALEGGKREVPLSIVMKLKSEFEINTEEFLYNDILDCNIVTKERRLGENKELYDYIKRIGTGEFKGARERMRHNHYEFSNRVIASNGLSSINVFLSDFESTLYICNSILKDYSINNMTSEDYALFENAIISKKDMMAKYQKAVAISRELYDIIKPFESIIEDLFNQIHKFDQEHDKTFYLGDD